MSQYGAVVLTTQGLTMITESVAKKRPLIFTKMALGDGALTNQRIENLTRLISQKQENAIHLIADKGAGLVDVSATITNNGLSAGYYARELGVFAKVGENGTEKLFAYTNAGANASYSPADGSLDEKLITVTFKVGTDIQVSIQLNSQVYLTQGALDAHNTNANAHKAQFDSIMTTVNSKLDNNSADYIKQIEKYLTGLKITKGDLSTAILDFIATSMNDSNNNKVPTLSAIKPLLGMGGIVAAKLDANAGFIKFANGFAIQWGELNIQPTNYYSEDNSLESLVYVDFPLRINRVCYAGVNCLGDVLGVTDEYARVMKVTDTQARIAVRVTKSSSGVGALPVKWFVLGIS